MTTKIIPSFPRYTINDKCEVYDTKNERVVSQHTDEDGYKQIHLVDADNIRKTRSIHRLMWEAFGLIEGEIMPITIDHINGDKKNNQITNLRPATHQEQGRNKKIRIDNTVGHKNITVLPSGSYRVQIWITADIRYRKTHKTFQEAIDDAIRVRNEHHGHFANNG